MVWRRTGGEKRGKISVKCFSSLFYLGCSNAFCLFVTSESEQPDLKLHVKETVAENFSRDCLTTENEVLSGDVSQPYLYVALLTSSIVKTLVEFNSTILINK